MSLCHTVAEGLFCSIDPESCASDSITTGRCVSRVKVRHHAETPALQADLGLSEAKEDKQGIIVYRRTGP